MQSVLNAKLAYNNTAGFIHEHVAHGYAVKMGDGLAETIEPYNIAIEYGNIPKSNKDYSSVREVLEDLLELTVDFQNKLNMCAKIALDEMDMHVYADLLDIIEDHNKFVQQAILLVDKIHIYGDNPSFDAHLGHFTIMGGED